MLDLVNYLETGDLSGARIEARRMSVMARYLKDRDPRDRRPSAALGLGSLLAGFAYEKSGNEEEAQRYFADANAVDWSAPTASSERAESSGTGSEDGELLVVVGWGRVPHRVAEHVPIGLALARTSAVLASGDREDASRLAAQGLVTWVSYPTLAPERALDEVPTVHAIRELANTSDSKEVKGVGFLFSLFAQAAMSAADVPDTRSWETLPARVGVARLRCSPGAHHVLLRARGTERDVRVAPGGWRAMSLFALR